MVVSSSTELLLPPFHVCLISTTAYPSPSPSPSLSLLLSLSLSYVTPLCLLNLLLVFEPFCLLLDFEPFFLLLDFVCSREGITQENGVVVFFNLLIGGSNSTE